MYVLPASITVYRAVKVHIQAGCYADAEEDGEKQRLIGIWICTFCNLTVKVDVLK